ncbi:hypothetical protein Glove_187g154 [Diversispora epigaea]|uniref:BED-type domain-containing protein n=1 Tax=Diversispora epigaea TaxID=1348612 RepID=A0A397ILQ8_9GLOM|nr:hypothetical protein Glove_187g154 [Diversispora epigaea]
MTKTGDAKFDEIWKYFIQDNNQRNGYYSVTCYHCDTTWVCGKPTVMKAHLANICKSCPEDISKYWRDKLAEQTINYTRTSKQSNLPHNQATITQHFSSNQPLPLQVNSYFLKELNPGYAPPSRTTLSGRFLDEEVAQVNKYIDQELENAENLTLDKY